MFSSVFARATARETEIVVRDRLDASGSDVRLARLAIGSDATSIYVANSTNFQESMLLPWIDLRDAVPTFNEHRKVELPERVVSRQKCGTHLG